MKRDINISRTQYWFKIAAILIIAAAVFLPGTCFPDFPVVEEIKCRNYCCTMFIKAIGIVIKHDGREDERILHSRTCELLEDSDSHEYLFCSDIELAFSRGFVKCGSCNLQSPDNDPCTAKCCKYYGWIIEPVTGILHKKDCNFLRVVKLRTYSDLAFVCSRHQTVEELIDKALVERTANYRICNSCFSDIIPRRYKLQPGLLRYYDSGEIVYDPESSELCLITMFR